MRAAPRGPGYDAAYLELAVRTGLAVATLDQALAHAVRAEGLPFASIYAYRRPACALHEADHVLADTSFQGAVKPCGGPHTTSRNAVRFPSALAPVEGNAIVAAHARNDLLERRRELMQRWAT